MTSDHELRPLGAFLLVLVQFSAFMTVSLVAVMMAELRGEGVESVLAGRWNVAAGLVLGPLTALYVGLNRYSRGTPTVTALGLERPSGRQVGWAVLAAGCGAGLAWTAGGVRRLDPVTAALFVTYALAAELFYRGLLQPRLISVIGAWRGLAVTFTLFVVGQIYPTLMLDAAGIGALAGLAAWRSRSTWPALAAHLAYQGARVILGAA